METPQTITVSRRDVITYVVNYDKVTINIDDYPELQGMSESEIQEHIKRYAYDMRGMFNNSLGEDIEYANVTTEQTEDEFIDWVFESQNEEVSN
jgi:hypothetical protein